MVVTPLTVTAAEETVVIAGDADGDGIADPVDNCVNDANPGQADADGDGVGDVCDVGGGFDPPTVDTDGDGIPDAQLDTDGDGVPDASDNCPAEANPLQTDTDGDLVGDACEYNFRFQVLPSPNGEKIQLLIWKE